MKMGWKTVVSALAVLLAAGVFVQLGLGAQSPEPSIAAEATVGSDDEVSAPASTADPARQPGRKQAGRDDRDNHARERDDRRDDGRKDRDDERSDRDDDRGRGNPDRDDTDDTDDAEQVQPVRPAPQPVDDDGPTGDDGGDDSDDGGGDD